MPYGSITGTARSGAELLLDVLEDEDVEYIFGNPGTTEMPLMHSLHRHPDMKYILGLQETAVVAMADGYAQASGKVGFVNLHTAGGLGHAMGAVLHARVAQTPLIISAGQQDTRHLFADPLLFGNLVKIAEPAVKWAYEIIHADDVPTLVRRAMQDSTAAPTGPVFLSLPINMMTATTAVDKGERSKIVRDATAGGLEELASALASAKTGRLAIVAGDEITKRNAIAEVVELAETTGAKVFGPSWPNPMSFPTDHALWGGNLPSTAAAISDMLAGFDALLVLGGHSLVSYLYSQGPAVPKTCALYQMSEDVTELARRYPTRLSCQGHLKSSLQALLPFVRRKFLAHQEAVNTARLAADADRNARLATLERKLLAEQSNEAISPLVAAAEVFRTIGRDIAVVDEAPATMYHVRSLLEKWPVRRYFFMRSAILGWGLPAAIGVSLGLDRSPVVALLGDGSALYSPQALWSAARYRVPVTFVVMNNAEYNILKKYSAAQGFDTRKNTVPGLEINDPFIDFMALAASMGVRSQSISRREDIGPAVREGIASGNPNLIEIAIVPE